MEPEQAQRIAHKLITLVPQWYSAECGPYERTLIVSGIPSKFFSLRNLTPRLETLLNHMRATIDSLTNAVLLSTPSYYDMLQEHYALVWLEQTDSQVNWRRLVDYLNSVSQRTSENAQVSLNIVITGDSGTRSIADSGVQKIVDQLATSPYTYVVVDKNLRFADFREISWSGVPDTASYCFHPAFLHPIHSLLGVEDFSAHVTSRGDIIIMNREGLLASRRKGGWKLYDVKTLKNSMVSCIGDYRIGCNLFEILFDLSFRRHGALLVYDPRHAVVHQVVNATSVLSAEQNESGQSLIGPSISGIAIGSGEGGSKWRRRLVELASIDGAVIFNDSFLLAAGAVIRSHESAVGSSGARSTAAESAYLWGGHPVKVSSDGEITFYFKSTGDGRECDARIEFL